MARVFLLSCFAVAFATTVDAKAVADLSLKEGEASILKEKEFKPLQPALEPESSQKFFSKDYPQDHSPPRNGLHFNHPYPAVQDSSEFDADFVKDQNTDNGEFHAQQNYDRIRMRIQSQYEKTAAALEKKKAAEKRLEETLEDFKEDLDGAKAKRSDNMNDLQEIDQEKKKEIEARKEETRTTPQPEPKKEGCMWPWSMWCCGWWPWSCPAKPTNSVSDDSDPMDKFREAHEELATDLAGAARQVEQIVRELKQCQEELEEAKKELQRLLDELQKAKLRKVEADEKVKQARAQESEMETRVAVAKEKLAEEIAEHAAAEAAYLKEKAKVEKLMAELKVLADKVKALRDAEDKDGGVYPVESKEVPRQSSAKSTGVLLLCFGLLAVVMN